MTAAAGPAGTVSCCTLTGRTSMPGTTPGWTDDLAGRRARHVAGDGARLLAVVHAAEITWQLARTWEGPRAREWQIKRQGGAARHYPLVPPGSEVIVKIRLHGTEEECREMAELLEQIMTIQAVSEPYPDRGRSVLVRVYVEGIPRGGR